MNCDCRHKIEEEEGTKVIWLSDVLLGKKSIEERFNRKVGMSETNVCGNFFCQSQGLNPRPLAQCKGEGKESSHYHVTTLVW